MGDMESGKRTVVLRDLLGATGTAGLADSTLLLSLHPDGSRVAVARGPALCICPVLPEPQSDLDLTEDLQALQERRGTHTAAVPQGRDASIGAGSYSRSRAGSVNVGSEAGRRSRNASAHNLSGMLTGGMGSAQLRPIQFMSPASSGPAVVGADDITAMAWLAFARPPGANRRSGGGAPSGAASGGGGGGDATAAYRRRTDSSGSGGVFASIQAMVEDQVELEQQQRRRQQLSQGSSSGGGPRSTGGGGGPPHPGYSCSVLLCGTRSGCLQLHDADSGAVLMRQQLHSGPVVSLAVRTWRMGMKPDDAVEDVTVAWADALVRLAAWELRTAAASCYAAAAARSASGGGGGGTTSLTSRFGLWGSSASATPAGPEVKPLAGQKWELPAALRNRTCAVCLGQRPRDLYSLLQGIGTSNATATGKTIFLAGGDKPACLAALEVDEQGGGGGGGALSVITSVASGVMGLARTARSVAAAPLTIGSSIASFMLNPLQLSSSTNTGTSGPSAGLHPSSSASSFSASGMAASSSAAAHPSDPAAIPLASFPDGTAGQRLPSTGCWRQHRDDGRVVGCLAPAPYGSLVAAADGLGRVTLVEAGGMLVSRLWKGYRDAQVGWLEVPLSALARRQQLLQQEAKLEQEEQSPDARAGGEQDQQEAPQRVKQQSAGGSGRPPLGGVNPASGSAASSGNRPRLGPQDILLSSQTHSHPPSRRGTGGGAGPPYAGFTQQQEDEPDEPEQYVLLLAIYAPRRQTLELWWPLHGDRLGAVAVPHRNARLLQRGGGGAGGGAELGTWRVGDAASAASPPMTPAGCMLCVAGGAAAAGGTGGAMAVGEEWAAVWGEGYSDVSWVEAAGLELLDVASMFGLQ